MSFSGSLISTDENQWRIEPTDKELDLEKLKRQEAILFYDELTLYEDELADNGTSNLNVKIRAMPSGFFILLRFFMRVDDVLIRCFDTRYHFETENSFILREYCERQSSIDNSKNDLRNCSDQNSVVAQLELKSHRLEKLFFQST